MQKKFYFLLFLVFGLIACAMIRAETQIPTVPTMISMLQGILSRRHWWVILTGPKIFMVNDSLNHEDIDAIQRLNERQEKDEKEKYQTASIRIHQNRNVNDSTSIIYYSNSYRNKIRFAESDQNRMVNGWWILSTFFIRQIACHDQ